MPESEIIAKLADLTGEVDSLLRAATKAEEQLRHGHVRVIQAIRAGLQERLKSDPVWRPEEARTTEGIAADNLALRQTIAVMTAENHALRMALAPFAGAWEIAGKGDMDFPRFTWDACRDAHAVIKTPTVSEGLAQQVQGALEVRREAESVKRQLDALRVENARLQSIIDESSEALRRIRYAARPKGEDDESPNPYIIGSTFDLDKMGYEPYPSSRDEDWDAADPDEDNPDPEAP